MNNMRFSFKKRQNRRSLNMKLVLLEVSNFYYVIYLEQDFFPDIQEKFEALKEEV